MVRPTPTWDHLTARAPETDINRMDIGRFLCDGGAERARMLDINRRLLHVEHLGIALFAVAGVIGIPTFGFRLLIPIALAALAFSIVQSRLERYRRPEVALAATWLFVQAMITLAIALAARHGEYLLPVYAFPVVIGSVIFSPRSVWVGFAVTALLTIGTAFAFNAGAVRAMPPILVCPMVVVAVLALTGSALRDLDVASRQTAIVDPLTGLLNRAALMARVAELTHHAAPGARGVALIVGDVDRFKAINDRYGHAKGDEVLIEIAYRMRKALGAFEPMYRFGGEEFVVLLPDADIAASLPAAERLRQAVSVELIAGLPVTMSFGVAASGPGEPFDFEAVFARADGALYAAKRGGRDRVEAGYSRVRAQVAPLRRQSERRQLAAQAALRTLPEGHGHSAGLERHLHGTIRRWLAIDRPQREHMVAMSQRLRRNFRRTGLLTFACIGVSAPWVGWRTLIAPVIAGATFNLVQTLSRRLERPEYALLAGWLLLQISIAVGFGMTSNRPLFALPLLVLMVVGSGAMFPLRMVVFGIVITAMLMTLVALRMEATVVGQNPVFLAMPLALLGAVGLTGWAAQQSSVYHRGTRVVDQLTGLLNRGALEARVGELAHQADLTGEQVSVIVGDIDSFKAVNDSVGHAVGDTVLQDVAERLRGRMRTFESVYRVGGDELTLLLAGVGSEDAANVARRLAAAIRSTAIAGRRVTMSFGVAASSPGGPFDYAEVFRRADSALYNAKRAGGDCVRIDGGESAAQRAA